MILLSLYGAKIGYSTGAWIITKRFAALPTEIPYDSGIQDKLVWEHIDILHDNREPWGDK